MSLASGGVNPPSFGMSPAGKKPFAIAKGDFFGDIGRKLCQPATLACHDVAVAIHAFIDPGIRTNQDAFGIFLSIQSEAVVGDDVAIGQTAVSAWCAFRICKR